MLIWKNDTEYLFGKTQKFIYRKKIASFDLDGTLIVTKSKKKFPVDENDWKFYDDNVRTKLENLIKEKYCFIIISNQGGIKGNSQRIQWMNKLNAIQKELNLEMLVFCSTHDNQFRKPLPMFFFEDNFFPQEIFINKSKLSFYCGDACGRHGDHADTDLKFALNSNLEFRTPEMMFKNSAINYTPVKNYPNVKMFLKSTTSFNFQPSATPEMIIMVGYPASGKSTLSSLIKEKYDYVIINQDTLQTKTKCFKFAVENLNLKKSVIIDNTNRDKKTREEWIKLANKNNYNVRCILLNTSKEHAMHNNIYRYLQTGKYISKIVYNKYGATYEPPEISEGFKNIIHVDNQITNNIDENIYSMYLY